jgi:hypothetical protein
MGLSLCRAARSREGAEGFRSGSESVSGKERNRESKNPGEGVRHGSQKRSD